MIRRLTFIYYVLNTQKTKFMYNIRYYRKDLSLATSSTIVFAQVGLEFSVISNNNYTIFDCIGSLGHSSIMF